MLFFMNYVCEESAEAAREYAARFQKLPKQAGILFVSVRAVPSENGFSKTFDICLGMSEEFEHRLGISIVQKVMENELDARSVVLRHVDVYCGVSGAGRDRGDQGHADFGPH